MRIVLALLSALLLPSCQPVDLPPLIEFERSGHDARAHGERLATVLGCRGCHGPNLQGRDWSDDMGRLWTANLTRTVERSTDEQLRRMLVSGARPERPLWGMPSHLFTQLAERDMTALIAYLRSIPPAGDVHPPPAMGPEAARLVADGVWKSSADEVAELGKAFPPDAGQEHGLGRYLVRSTCAECHGMDLKGGQPEPTATPRPDLRLVAAYSLAEFRTLLRTGKAAGGRDVGLMSEIARNRYSHLTGREIASLHAYLQAVAARRD